MATAVEIQMELTSFCGKSTRFQKFVRPSV